MGSSASERQPKQGRLNALFDQIQQQAMAEPGTAPRDNAGRELADWTVRVVATSVDVVVLTLVQSVAKAVHLGSLALFIFDWVLVFGYLCSIAWRGVTIGNLVTKTKVVDAASGQVLSLRRAALRTLSLLGLILTLIGAGIDALLPLVDVRRQSLHDKAASSLVVRTGRVFRAANWTEAGDLGGH